MQLVGVLHHRKLSFVGQLVAELGHRGLGVGQQPGLEIGVRPGPGDYPRAVGGRTAVKFVGPPADVAGVYDPLLQEKFPNREGTLGPIAQGRVPQHAGVVSVGCAVVVSAHKSNSLWYSRPPMVVAANASLTPAPRVWGDGSIIAKRQWK